MFNKANGTMKVIPIVNLIQRFWRFYPIFIALGLVFMLLRSNSPWVLPEQFYTRSEILRAGGGDLCLKSFAACLDYRIMENAPRVTRFGSNLLDLLDTTLRSNLWRWIPPHASLSLSWLFCLILAPVCVYKAVRAFGIEQIWASWAVALLVTSAGVLSHVVMNFRPGKAVIFCLTCVQILLCAMLLMRSERICAPWSLFNVSITSTHIWVFVTAGLAAFFDESFLVVALVPLIYAPRLFFNFINVLILLAAPALFTGASIALQFALFHAFDIPLPRLLNYAPLSGALPFNLASFLNCWLISLSDAVLGGLALPKPLGWASLKIISLVFLGSVFFVGLITILQNALFSKKQLSSASQLVLRSTVAILSFSFIHAVLMSRVENSLWGIFYYGTYICVPAVLAWIGCVLLFRPRKIWLSHLALFSLLVSQFTSFYFLNIAYRDFHYYPHRPLQISKVFTGEIDRYTRPTSSLLLDREEEIALWNKARTTILDDSYLSLIPRPQLYIPIESSPGSYFFPLPVMWSWANE